MIVSSSRETLFPTTEERHMESVPKINSILNSIPQMYSLHDSITVNNDSELAAIANSGEGSVNDPYIITGRDITGSLTDGIYIMRTTKHFHIENCSVYDLLN